jgi:hypothetical protein
MVTRAALRQIRASISAKVQRGESCIMDRPLTSCDGVVIHSSVCGFLRRAMTPRSTDRDGEFDDPPEHKPAGYDDVTAHDAQPKSV